MDSTLHVYRTILVSAAGGFIAGAFIKISSVIFRSGEEERGWGRHILSIGRSGIVWGLLFGLSVFPLFSGNETGLFITGLWLAACSFLIELCESVFFSGRESDE